MTFNRKDHHLIGEITPRFKLRSAYEADDLYGVIDQHVKEDPSVIGKIVHEQYYLDIPKHLQHFWSPELRIYMDHDYDDEPGTVLRCIIGPSYVVWVLFVFLYAVLGVLCLFGGMYGIVQWSMGNPTIWAWCLPVTLFCIGGLYLTAKAGQSKARDEMLHLVSVLYHSLKEKELERIES